MKVAPTRVLGPKENLKNISNPLKSRGGGNLKKFAENIGKKSKEFLKSSKSQIASNAATSTISNIGSAIKSAVSSPAAKVELSQEAKARASDDKVQEEDSKKALEKARLADSAKKSEKSEKIQEQKKHQNRKKPGIFFVSGFDMFSGVSGGSYDGIRLMAESQKGARLYDWQQKNEIMEQIDKIDPGYPIVLVGHSLGADTAVEIAKELNTLENGFRKIDLLVTLDSVGNSNDVIPQNVGKNLNVISDDSGFLSDGPNIARNADKTDVRNIMRQESHTELDDVSEVQADIMEAIQDSLFDGRMERL